MGISYNNSIVRDGLVLHLDPINSKSYTGVTNDWKDISGNANNSLVQNGSSLVGNSFILDGVDDYIKFSNPITLTDTDFTLQFFGSIDDFSTRRGTFKSYGLGEFSNSTLYFVKFNVDGVTNSANLYYYNTPIPVAENFMWNFCFYHESRDHEVFLNGQSAGRRSDMSDYPGSSIEFQFTDFGISLGVGSRMYIGSLGQIQIYNKALTSQEIQQNFNAMRDRYGI